jgi:hypothetical protein
LSARRTALGTLVALAFGAGALLNGGPAAQPAHPKIAPDLARVSPSASTAQVTWARSLGGQPHVILSEGFILGEGFIPSEIPADPVGRFGTSLLGLR